MLAAYIVFHIIFGLCMTCIPSYIEFKEITLLDVVVGIIYGPLILFLYFIKYSMFTLFNILDKLSEIKLTK